jgi:hypothetical protein
VDGFSSLGLADSLDGRDGHVFTSYVVAAPEKDIPQDLIVLTRWRASLNAAP